MRKAILFMICIGMPVAASAQESQIGGELRREGEQLKSSCSGFSFSSIGGCAQTLFTGQPLHIAIGSLAPQNGVGAGLAFVSHFTPNETWRLSWDADAAASGNASWRAGAYLTAVYTPRRHIGVSSGTAKPSSSNLAIGEHTTFHVYAEADSLNTLLYFGLGQQSSEASRTFFGMRETVVGTNAVVPLYAPLNLSLYGEANGRFVQVRGDRNAGGPSIEQLYNNQTAPGLADQPAFAQFGEGIRARPSFANGHIRLNYSLNFQQYLAGNSSYSFRRLTTDLANTFPLYRNTRTYLPKDANGPDDCSSDVAVHKCPAITRNLEGSVSLRFLLTQSFVSSGNVVPFYFDPTIGGSNINGIPWLASYQDYRFRGPNLMVLRATFEHSIYGPVGFTFGLDEGKVALRRQDLDFSHVAHSYYTGLTIRAGGLPVVYLLFAWGGHEGHHTVASINNALLGASPRPSLF